MLNAKRHTLKLLDDPSNGRRHEDAARSLRVDVITDYDGDRNLVAAMSLHGDLRRWIVAVRQDRVAQAISPPGTPFCALDIIHHNM